VEFGYARISTQDQNLELQREALVKAGCQRVFEDKISGTRSDRPGLAKALEILRSGDTLVVWKLDRLGRSVKQLVDLVGKLHEQGIHFKSLTDAIDTCHIPDDHKDAYERDEDEKRTSLSWSASAFCF
jgi:DNA invertase Pin-like site-specific DNA recombinase